jgi:hypothetical protein
MDHQQKGLRLQTRQGRQPRRGYRLPVQKPCHLQYILENLPTLQSPGALLMIEPTCRFCKQRMVSSGTRVGDYGKPTEHTVGYLHICHRCHSEQCFAPNGRALDYEFTIGRYTLFFNPQERTFKVIHYPNGRLRPGENVFHCNYCPTNYTPTTMTLERLQTLILFS